MIEGLKNVITTKPESEASELGSDQTVESTALAGAAAIQQLIAERDRLRNCASSQRGELAGLSSINEDLRRRLALIRQHYVELGTKVLAQFQQFDEAVRKSMQETPVAPSASEDATLITLAHRLAPCNGHSRPFNRDEP